MDAVSDYLDKMVAETLRIENGQSQEKGAEAEKEEFSPSRTAVSASCVGDQSLTKGRSSRNEPRSVNAGKKQHNDPYPTEKHRSEHEGDGASSEEAITLGCLHDDEPLHRCMGHHKLPIVWEDVHGDQLNPGKGDQKPVTMESDKQPPAKR